MRLLVTDTAAQSPRQVAAWLIMTFGRKDSKTNLDRIVFAYMSRLELLEREALSLSDSDRATLAAHLLESLPAVMSDLDDGIAEASRRDLDFEDGHTKGISWETLRKNIGR